MLLFSTFYILALSGAAMAHPHLDMARRDKVSIGSACAVNLNSLEASKLKLRCTLTNGKASDIVIPLSDYVANNGGKLGFRQGGNYQQSCTDCRMSLHEGQANLICKCSPAANDGAMQSLNIVDGFKIDTATGTVYYTAQDTGFEIVIPQ